MGLQSTDTSAVVVMNEVDGGSQGPKHVLKHRVEHAVSVYDIWGPLLECAPEIVFTRLTGADYFNFWVLVKQHYRNYVYTNVSLL